MPRSAAFSYSTILFSFFLSSAEALSPVVGPGVRPARAPQIDTLAVRLLDRATQQLVDARTLLGQVRTTYSHNGVANGPASVVAVTAMKPRWLRLEYVPVAPTAPTSPSGTSTPATSVAPRASGGSGAPVLITGDALAGLLATMRHSAVDASIHLYTPDGGISYVQRHDTAHTQMPSDFSVDVDDINLRPFFGENSRRVGVWAHDRINDLLLRSVRSLGTQSWNDTTYTVVEWTYEHAFTLPQDTVVYTTRFFLGEDHLIHRTLTTATNGYVIDRRFDLQLNADVSARDFGRPSRPGFIVIGGGASRDTAKAVLGQTLPGLSRSATFLDSGSVVLQELLQQHRALVLWLWSYHCSSCIEEFPLAERLARERASTGTAVIALDYVPGDEPLARAMRTFNATHMPIIFGATSWTEFMIRHGITAVILDGHGRITYQGNFDPRAIGETLDRLTIPSRS